MKRGDISMKYVVAIIIALMVLIVVLIIFNEAISQFAKSIQETAAGIWSMKPDLT